MSRDSSRSRRLIWIIGSAKARRTSESVVRRVRGIRARTGRRTGRRSVRSWCCRLNRSVAVIPDLRMLHRYGWRSRWDWRLAAKVSGQMFLSCGNFRPALTADLNCFFSVFVTRNRQGKGSGNKRTSYLAVDCHFGCNLISAQVN